MSIPAILWIILTALGLLVVANRHGKPQAPYSLKLSLIGATLQSALLFWGGFFG